MKHQKLNAIEYTPNFVLYDLQPNIGQLFHFYVPQRFISLTHQPVIDRVIYGSPHYSPESDIATVVMHSGCLFLDPKIKSTSNRHFYTVCNINLCMCCSDNEFHKRAIIKPIPLDVHIDGVLVTIAIDASPMQYTAVLRNGIRTRESGPTDFSIKVTNFHIITAYDEKPNIVPPNEFIRGLMYVPTFEFSFTGEIGMQYTPQLFSQIFSLPNLVNGLFRAYRAFFDSSGSRYEIVASQNYYYSKIVKLIDPVSVEILNRKKSSVPEVEVIVESFDLNSVKCTEHSIVIGTVEFKPVETILLVTIAGKMSRSPSIRLST